MSEVNAVMAADCRAEMMVGPGSRWALVRWAQLAIFSGPRVYWDWRVPGGLHVNGCRRLHVGEHTADVAEFAVFEQQELLSAGDFIQAFDGAFRKIIDDVGVCFQHADVVAHLLCQP